MFVYLLIPGSIVYDDTLPGAIPIPRDRLAWIEQKEDLLHAHRYTGEPFLTAYHQQTGHWFHCREARYQEHTPRMVVDLALKAEAIQALADDITVPTTQVVDMVTGYRWNRDLAVQERQRHYQAAITRRSRYPETNALLDYLNMSARDQTHRDDGRRMGVADSRKDLMRRALARYGAEAAQVALNQHLGWPQDAAHKKPLKTALYAIMFGARDRNLPLLIAEKHAGHPALAAIGPEAVVRRLLGHPLIAALIQRRDIRLAKVESQGGSYDCYGEYIPLPHTTDHTRRWRPQAHSVLAQETQAMEFAMVSAAFELAQTTSEFTIIHWTHDGFMISIRDRRCAASWIAQITACVNERAANYGVCTELDLTSAPHT